MNRLASLNGVSVDMVASPIRSHVVILHDILATIEWTNNFKEDYIFESLKTVENEIRRLRKTIDHWL